MIVPNEEDCRWTGGHIENEVEHGKVSDSTRDKFLEIVNKVYEESKADAVILGFTELPMVLKNIKLRIPVLDATEIHIQSIINKIVE